MYDANTNINQNIHKRMENQVSERRYVPNHPLTNATTNKAMQRRVVDNNNNTVYNLRPTINPGGMEGVPTMPTLLRGSEITEFDNNKVDIRRKIYEMQQERNLSIGNIPFQETRA